LPISLGKGYLNSNTNDKYKLNGFRVSWIEQSLDGNFSLRITFHSIFFNINIKEETKHVQYADAETRN